MACTIHANSAKDALDALVNAALMAGENIPERVVKKVFSSSIDLVVHLDRGGELSAERMERRTMEIRAVVPSLHDDFSTEAIFTREQVRAPLEWTGALPPGALANRLERVLPPGVNLPGLLEVGMVEW